MSGPGRAGALVWPVLFLLASVMGALAAADIVHVSVLAALVVAVLITVVLTLLLRSSLLDPGRNGDIGHPGQHAAGGQGLPGSRAASSLPGSAGSSLPGSRTASSGPAPPAPGDPALPQPGVRPDPFQPDAGRGSRRPAQATVRLMQQPVPAASPWWKPGRTVPPPAAAEAAVAPPLSSYLDSALIAQCPNCGSFRIDADQAAPRWRFGCQECRHTWTWLPGHPWPQVQVRP